MVMLCVSLSTCICAVKPTFMGTPKKVVTSFVQACSNVLAICSLLLMNASMYSADTTIIRSLLRLSHIIGVSLYTELVCLCYDCVVSSKQRNAKSTFSVQLKFTEMVIYLMVPCLPTGCTTR